jgi:hypothetical protein
MTERHENPPKKRAKNEKQKEEQWDFEAALIGYVLPEVSRLFYSSKVGRTLNNTSCASPKTFLPSSANFDNMQR